MKAEELFETRRECVCCQASASSNKKKREPGEPVIVSISLTIYRKGIGKAAQVACRRVQICDACLTRALAPSLIGQSRQARRLMDALRESISVRYSGLLEADEMQSDDPEVWKQLRASLPFPTTGGAQ